MSLEDARNRMMARKPAPPPAPIWDRPEYVEDVARFNPLLRNLARAVAQRFSPTVLLSRLARDRRQQFKRRSTPCSKDTIETFRSVHLRYEEQGSAIRFVVTGSEVRLRVNHRSATLDLDLGAFSWWCEALEDWWDGCHIGPTCYALGRHFHPFLTTLVPLREEAAYVHAALASRRRRSHELESIEEAVVFCAAHFGIPDAEIVSSGS